VLILLTLRDRLRLHTKELLLDLLAVVVVGPGLLIFKQNFLLQLLKQGLLLRILWDLLLMLLTLWVMILTFTHTEVLHFNLIR
jgi:hypothetical protein